MKPKFSFARIDAHLLVGSCPQDPDDIAALAGMGVTGVLNLQSDSDIRQRGLRWSGMWKTYVERGISIERVPIEDFDKEDFRRHIGEAVERLDALVVEGRTVYLHCNAGINRSPTVGIAWYVARRGWSVDAAAQHFLSKREIMPYLDVVGAWLEKG